MAFFRSRPHFEDRQMVQWMGDKINLSGQTNFSLGAYNTYIYNSYEDFLNGISGGTFNNVPLSAATDPISGWTEQPVYEPGAIRIVPPVAVTFSGNTDIILSSTTVSDVTGSIATAFDSLGTVVWSPASEILSGSVANVISGTCLPTVKLNSIEPCNPVDGININTDVTINGNFNVVGTVTSATTIIETEIVKVEDNNIELNYGGDHNTAIGGGITVLSGQPNNTDSRIYTDSNGYWLFEPGLAPGVLPEGYFTSGSTGVGSITSIPNKDTGGDTLGDYSFVGGFNSTGTTLGTIIWSVDSLVDSPLSTIIGGRLNTIKPFISSSPSNGNGRSLSIFNSELSKIEGSRPELTSIFNSRNSIIGKNEQDKGAPSFSSISNSQDSNIFGGNQYIHIFGGNSNTIELIGGENNNIFGGSENIISGVNITYSTVVGGRRNSFIGGKSDKSTILGGDRNTITGGPSYVLDTPNGPQNVDGSAENSTIVGGEENIISGHTNAFIGGGRRNVIDFNPLDDINFGPYNEFIVGGEDNYVSSSNSGIFGGNNNILSGISSNSTIQNGNLNVIKNSTTSTIINGINNQINITPIDTTDTNYLNDIIGSVYSSITGRGSFNSIINGSNSNMYGDVNGYYRNTGNISIGDVQTNGSNNYNLTTLNNSLLNTSYNQESTFIGNFGDTDYGYRNIFTYNQKSLIIGTVNGDYFKQDSRIDNLNRSVVVGGLNNQIDNVEDSVIIGGRSNDINSAVSSMSINAYSSSLSQGVNNSFLFNTSSAEINGVSEYCGVFGGDDNLITNESVNSHIFGSEGSLIDESNISNVFSSFDSNVSASTRSNIYGSSFSSIRNSKDSNMFGTINSNILNSEGSTIQGGTTCSIDNSIGSHLLASGKGIFISGGSLNTIVGGTANQRIYDGVNSSILGGQNNFIEQSSVSTIIGGGGNKIEPLSTNANVITQHSGIFVGFENTIAGGVTSAIVGGQNNIISGHTNAFIGGGNGNFIDTATENPVILGGAGNKNFGSSSGIIAGAANEVYSDFSVITGSHSSKLYGTYNLIAGGYGNEIYGMYNGILGGKYNSISGSSSTGLVIDNIILGGEQNKLVDTSRSVILGGFQITGSENDTVYVPKLNIQQVGTTTSVNNLGIDIDGNVVIGSSGGSSTGSTSLWEVGGVPNSLQVVGFGAYSTTGDFSINASRDTQVNGKQSVSIGGTLNEISTNGEDSSVVGGSFNRVFGSSSSIVGGGNNTNSSNDSFIGGGSENEITSQSDNSSIIGGSNNTLTYNYYGGYTDNSTILGGYGNYAKCNRCSIIGGANNTNGYGYDASNNTIILGGEGNTLSSYDGGSVIIGGLNNTNTSGSKTSIIGGRNNIIGNTTNTTILGGEYNEIDSGNHSVIIGGKGNSVSSWYSSIMTSLDSTVNVSSNFSVIIGGQNNETSNSSNVMLLSSKNSNIDSSNNSVIIGGENNVISAPLGVNNSVVLGGEGITGTTDNTVYVPKLNINELATGDTVTNLGLNSDGDVVSSPLIMNNGITSNRPTSPQNFEQYFDTTLGYPIVFNGTNWVDYSGNIV